MRRCHDAMRAAAVAMSVGTNQCRIHLALRFRHCCEAASELLCFEHHLLPPHCAGVKTAPLAVLPVMWYQRNVEDI